MLGAADHVDGVARLLAALALLVSVVAALAAHRQAQGQRAANAPSLTARIESNVIYLTFHTPLRVRKAIVSVPTESPLKRIGEPGETEATRTKVVLRDIPSEHEILLPAALIAGAVYAPIDVTMSGHGFGKVSTTVAPPVEGTGPWFAY